MTILSIAIPTYNRLSSLQRCLDSVLSSTREDIQVVVSDNGSTDGTSAWLDTLSDSRLVIRKNENNLGYSQNFLRVLRAAEGKWIFFLTDDDYFLPGGLERLLAVLEQNPDLGCCLIRLKVCDEDGRHTSNYRPYKRTGRLSAGREALVKLFWATHTLSGIVVRREWVDFAGTERHLDSLYPQMYMFGSVAKSHPAYYIDESLVVHTVGNRTFWNYTDDFMVASRISLIEDLLPGDAWKEERDILIKQLISDVFKYHVPLAWAESEDAFIRHQTAVLRSKSVALSPEYWRGVAKFVISETTPWKRFLKRGKSTLRKYAKVVYLKFRA